MAEIVSTLPRWPCPGWLFYCHGPEPPCDVSDFCLCGQSSRHAAPLPLHEKEEHLAYEAKQGRPDFRELCWEVLQGTHERNCLALISESS